MSNEDSKKIHIHDIQKKKAYQKLLLYIACFVVVIALSIFYFLRAKTKRAEFERLKNVQSIDQSMPIGFIEKRFGIPEQEILSELGLPQNPWNRRFTIDEVCKKNNLDCPTVIESLNKKIRQ